MSATALALGASTSPSLRDGAVWPGWHGASRDAGTIAAAATIIACAIGGGWVYRLHLEGSGAIPILASAAAHGSANGSHPQPPIVVPPPPLDSKPTEALVPEDADNQDAGSGALDVDLLPALDAPRTSSPPPPLAEPMLPGLSEQDARSPISSAPTGFSPKPDMSLPNDATIQEEANDPRLSVRGVSTPPPEKAAGVIIPAARNVVAKAFAVTTQVKQDQPPASLPTTADPPARTAETPRARIEGPISRVLARSRPTVLSPAVQREDGMGEPLALVGSEVIASTLPGSSAAQSPPNSPPAPVVTASQELVPLNENGRRYLVVGSQTGNASREYDLVENVLARRDESLLATSGTALAGPAAVRSFVRKTDPSSVEKVISYDVKIYLALDGDTFQKVADLMYHDPSYARSLAEYNRSRLGVTERIPLGARVRIPPRWVLDGGDPPAPREQFRQVDVPSVEQAVRAPTAFVSASSPSGPRESLFDPGLASRGPTMNGLVYRVAQEETLWSIAAKTLGDGRRWREIQKLNGERILDGVQVPAGTILRLPDDAVHAQ